MKTKYLVHMSIVLIVTLSSTQNAISQWQLNGNSNATSGSKLGTLNGIPLTIWTNNQERMRIDTLGNVGIGTTTPTQKLHVVGNILSTGSISGNQGSFPFITVSNSLIQSSGSDLYASGLLPSTTSGTTPGNVILSIAAPGFGNWKVGNVGIGTTTPVQRLHVAGASILANNTIINPSAISNTVIAGAIHDGSGWAVASGIGGKATIGQAWGIGAIGSNLYFGFSNGSSDNTMQTGIQITGSRNVLLVPGGSGNVGIGSNSPVYKLDVCGTIRAKEVLVQTGWCDYVFNKGYQLRSLNEVESYINKNQHLPDVPSATEVESNGVKVAQMDSVLIKKIEELTLYVIDQNKQIKELQRKVIQLEEVDADKKNQ